MRVVSAFFARHFVTWDAQAQSPADSYPNKPIRIIVPFAPGGIVDTSARVIGQELSKRWGQQVVVENRPGGNGFIGVMATVKAPADGYTLLMAHTGEFGGQSGDLPGRAVRPRSRPRAHHHDHRSAHGRGGERQPPDQDHAGVARDRQGEARDGRRVHPRHRFDQPPGAGVDEPQHRRRNSCTSPTRAAHPRSPPPPAARCRPARPRWAPRCRTSSRGACGSSPSPLPSAALSTSPGRR